MYPGNAFDSSSNLEAAIQRDMRRGQPTPKVQVRTVEDIRRVLAEFDPSRDRGESVAEVTGDLQGNVDGKVQSIAVSAKTVGKSKRQLLVEAVQHIADLIKSTEREVLPVEINGKIVKPPQVSAANASYNIDPMIAQWLDAKRNGTIIYWDLTDGYWYKYEPISHKLTRADRLETV